MIFNIRVYGILINADKILLVEESIRERRILKFPGGGLDISAQGILRNKLMDARNSVGHLHYFMKETALATLVDSGYDIVDFFYTAGSLDLPTKTLRSKIAVLPRKLMFKLNEDIAVKLLGGFSLLVLTKN